MDETPAPSKMAMLLGYLFLIGLPVVGILAISGLVRLLLVASEPIAKWGLVASAAAVVLSVFALLPMAAFKATRRFAGGGLSVLAAVLWITLWFASISVTYHEWGSTAAIIGLLFAGVGIVPMAVLAALFSGEWIALMVLLGLVGGGLALSWAGSNTLDNSL